MRFWNVAFMGSALLIAGSLFATLENQDKQTSEAIKKGELKLFCEFSDGERQVPADKFMEMYEINGKLIFKFKNGAASNCRIEK